MIAPPRIPGQLIAELLEARGWTKRVLAIVLGQDETALNKIIAGKRSVTADLALSLGEVFDVPPERFLDLQASYDLARARLISRPDPRRTTRAHLFGGLPVTEMIRRGWLRGVEDVRDVQKAESALARFFGASRVDEIEILPHAAKKTAVVGPTTASQLAWLYRVKEIAAEMILPRYSLGAARDAIGKLAALLSAPEEARKAPRILMDAGIRFALVESLPGAKIDGVCFWLNDTSPVIGMTMRYDRMDNFWFVLRHELEHVLRGHGHEAAMLDAELEGDRAGVGAAISDEERQANEAAAEFCVPQRELQRFIARKEPVFAERDLLGFARTLRIHPGLVAGQLQRHTGRYDRFRNHLVKVRHHVAPSATVDGWGDVVPTDV